MSGARFGALVGLALGAIWAIAGFPAALIAALTAAIGTVVALVIEGRVDLTEYLGHERHDGPTSR